jgi:pimeloyl-ACP methyl ester carboxylesterase
MATFDHGDVHLHYEEHGSGFPVLLVALGGLRSTIAAWEKAPWNPIEQLAPNYRVIALDQRNAGSSRGPIRASDGWHTYTADQLALLDHLGVDRFHMLGMCVGGAHILSMLRTAPERVAAAVFLQPIGLEGNREAFHELFDGWREEIRDAHPEAGEDDWAGLRRNLYGGDDVLWSASTAQIATFDHPMLVLMGNDRFHPQVASRTLAATAPDATLVEQWKDADSLPVAQKAVAEFLAAHTP